VRKQIKCLFCGTPIKTNRNMIEFNKYVICGNCIEDLNKSISKNDNLTPSSNLFMSASKNKSHKFDIKQLDSVKIKHFLDKFVIGQEPAKMALSVSVVNHYKRMIFNADDSLPLDKSNLLIIGPSGSGKSLLVSTIAKYLKVPFITVDATTLTEAGYIGENVDTILSRLVLAADGDIDMAEHGIVFIDEIDKLASGTHKGATTENKLVGVQSALLKLIENSTVRISLADNQNSPLSPPEINTKNILFIGGGAFFGLDKIIKNRLKQKKSIGFIDNSKTSENISNCITDDFIEYGLIPEFIGRFPLKAQTTSLSDDELTMVLTKLDNSILSQFKFYFDIDNIQLSFTSDFIDEVVKRAQKSKTGVRGLREICESIMLPHFYLLPEYKKRNISSMIFNAKCITDNAIPKIALYNINMHEKL
jgi:ATP-dependent Clp protease ATP-binding subunit ClpX